MAFSGRHLGPGVINMIEGKIYKKKNKIDGKRYMFLGMVLSGQQAPVIEDTLDILGIEAGWLMELPVAPEWNKLYGKGYAARIIAGDTTKFDEAV